jgi:hypothetical protein
MLWVFLRINQMLAMQSANHKKDKNAKVRTLARTCHCPPSVSQWQIPNERVLKPC